MYLQLIEIIIHTSLMFEHTPLYPTKDIARAVDPREFQG